MEGFLEAVLNLGSLALMIGGISSIFAPFFRFFRSSGIVRQQMKWLAYAAVLVLILGVLSIPIWYLGGFSSPARLEASITLTNLVMMLIAVTVATAVIGYRLYDIDVLINRTLVYSLMTGAIVLIYVIIVGAAGIAFQSQGNWLLTLLATGLVAILFEPIRDRLQRAVNHLLYGQRDEPFEVMAQLGQSLEQSLSPASVYPMIVRTVARAMRLPYVAIQIPDGRRRRTVEAYGTSTNEPVSFDLTYQGETVGWLQVGPRSPNEAFSPADKRLLQNIALQAGAAVHNIRLTDDLQRSRQQIVTSREEERRRLRRDLHDGLGPSLASLGLQAGVLRRLIRDNPDAAVELAEEMQGDIRATIDDIRRVVYALRPPALDDLGLVPAIQVLAAKLGRGNGQGQSQNELQVQIEAPEELPPLPAAVEVAAYRIIHEALTNVVHHAGARCAIVRIWLEEDLHIVVEDDGVGLSGARAGGMGLLSMRERTDEISGRFAIAGRPAGGTIITVTLPVRTA